MRMIGVLSFVHGRYSKFYLLSLNCCKQTVVVDLGGEVQNFVSGRACTSEKFFLQLGAVQVISYFYVCTTTRQLFPLLLRHSCIQYICNTTIEDL